MRIISKIADYYDKVSYLFGQDPDITYHRKDIDSKDIVMRVAAYDNHCYARNYKYGNVLCDCRYKYTQRIVDWQTIIAGQYAFKIGSSTEEYVTIPILEFSSVLTDTERIELQRAVGAPVFTIHNAERTENPGFVKITVDSYIPNLKDLGISKLVTAEQMWQSVYHCLTNVLRVNPDKQPPASLSNQERIWASGFDEKVSFRHRK